MAQPPHAPPPPAKPAAPPPKLPEHQTDAQLAKLEQHDTAPPDPLYPTVAHEQRERAREIEAMGVDAWKAANDDRVEIVPEKTAKKA
jgi:hypothetical protein